MATSKRVRLAEVLDRFGALRALQWLARRPGLLVLNYHRIGSAEGSLLDDGVFSATPADFRTQVRHLREHFEMPTLDDVVAMRAAGFPLRRAMALITFDDGYRDNHDIAFPILKEAGAPATFFIPTSYIQRPRLPWWDHISYVMKTTARDRITLDYPIARTIDLGVMSRAGALGAVLKIYKQAIGIRPDEFLAHLGERAGVEVDGAALGRDLFMSWDQIRQMDRGGMSIGSHTHTHPILSSLTDAEQRAELFSSKEILEAELGRKVDTLAYPVGGPYAFNAVTKRCADEAGYRMAFSYYGGINRAGHDDPFDVRRTTVDSDVTVPLFRARAALQTLAGRSI